MREYTLEKLFLITAAIALAVTFVHSADSKHATGRSRRHAPLVRN